MSRRFAIVALSCLTLGVSATPARAFSYDEHSRLSNRALLLAVIRRSPNAPGGIHLTASDSGAIDRFTKSLCRRGDNGSFGDLTALVDYGLSPLDYYMAAPDDSALAELVAGRVSPRELEALGGSRLTNLAAAHVNRDHFQDRALLSYWFWHDAAIKTVVADRNVIRGLILEAFAEHFLEDAFAPGHVATPRRGFHDVPSLSMHNYYNRMGADFRPSHTDSLAALLENGVPGNYLPDAPRSASEAARRLASLVQSGIQMFGDNGMARTRDQEFFMTLVVGRSAADVIDSYVEGRKINSFSQYTWAGYTISEGRVYKPGVDLPFGSYLRELSGPPTFGLIVAANFHQVMPLADGGHSSRIGGGAETLVAGFPGKSWIANVRGESLDTPPQMGLLVGYSATAGATSSRGPTARVIIPIVDINSQFSVGVSRRRYASDAGQLEGAWQGTLSYELGLGFAWFNIGIARDYSFVGTQLRPRPALISGLTVGYPIWPSS